MLSSSEQVRTADLGVSSPRLAWEVGQPEDELRPPHGQPLLPSSQSSDSVAYLPC